MAEISLDWRLALPMRVICFSSTNLGVHVDYDIVALLSVRHLAGVCCGKVMGIVVPGHQTRDASLSSLWETR